jgi:hypothetical protein
MKNDDALRQITETTAALTHELRVRAQQLRSATRTLEDRSVRLLKILRALEQPDLVGPDDTLH